MDVSKISQMLQKKVCEIKTSVFFNDNTRFIYIIVLISSCFLQYGSEFRIREIR